MRKDRIFCIYKLLDLTILKEEITVRTLNVLKEKL